MLYSESRLSYPQPLYDAVLRHHAETGGGFDFLLDVGCGPGNATRDLSPSFAHAAGFDAGDEMIQAARWLGGKTGSGEEVGFHVSPAEKIAETDAVPPGSVDLLTAPVAESFLI
jgi:predicted TPR repeat methyltransferase